MMDDKILNRTDIDDQIWMALNQNNRQFNMEALIA